MVVEAVFCAHADQNGEGAHWKYPDERCPLEPAGLLEERLAHINERLRAGELAKFGHGTRR